MNLRFTKAIENVSSMVGFFRRTIEVCVHVLKCNFQNAVLLAAASTFLYVTIF
jgi:hypothetical protein